MGNDVRVSSSNANLIKFIAYLSKESSLKCILSLKIETLKIEDNYDQNTMRLGGGEPNLY